MIWFDLWSCRLVCILAVFSMFLFVGFISGVHGCTILNTTALLLPLVIEDAIKVGVTRNRSIIQSVMKRFLSQLVANGFRLRAWKVLLKLSLKSLGIF